jgi:acetyl-CoA acetyltransferase
MTAATGALESSSPRGLRDRYAVVGVGETAYTRGSGRTTRSMASEALANAMADAGLRPSEVDGMMSYSSGDSTSSTYVAADLGIRLNFHQDVVGGGQSTETLIGIAMGVIEAGLCTTVALFRSMNGFSGKRFGGTGRAIPVLSGESLLRTPYGITSPAQNFSPYFMRHMYEYGTRPEQVAMLKVVQSGHASQNPKAIYKNRVTVEDVLCSRMIAAPLHLMDCCTETDGAAALIVTSAARAAGLRQVPVRILSVVGRCSKPRTDDAYQFGPISRSAPVQAAELLWGNAGLGPEDVDLTGSYDAFSYGALIQLEDWGFCAKGEGGAYVGDGRIALGGSRPNNTSGGQLCEGYTHGMNLVVENVRQLRGEADDYCPAGPNGRRAHTYDYRPGGCRQVRDARVSANIVSTTHGSAAGVVLRRG